MVYGRELREVPKATSQSSMDSDLCTAWSCLFLSAFSGVAYSSLRCVSIAVHYPIFCVQALIFL